MRIQPAEYGLELNEYDPYFNYRATKYLLDNGLNSYLNWHDEKSWYPEGRDVVATSQIGLHITTAVLYNIFNLGSDLKTFVIIFPVVIGSLTTIIFFFFIRNALGLRTAMFASVFFAIAFPIIMRGTIGWFKSEPLGLFYGFLSLLILSFSVKSTNPLKTTILTVLSGLTLYLGISSWGGVFFFLGTSILYLILLPIFRERKIMEVVRMPILYMTIIMLLPIMGRTSNLLSNNILYLLIPGFIYGIILTIKYLKGKKRVIVISVIILGLLLCGHLFLNIINNDNRYNYIINPTSDESKSLFKYVAEHQPLNLPLVLEHNAFLVIFAGVGVIALIKQNGEWERKLYILMLILFGTYIGTSIVRLEMFLSIAMIVLSAYGLDFLFKKMSERELKPKKKKMVTIISLLLIISMVFPSAHAWYIMSGAPPMILNGGGTIITSTEDWYDAMNWLKTNTSESSVIFAWWDYGYWITTLSDRTTVMDNAAISSSKIIKMAEVIVGKPDISYQTLKDMGADYILFNVQGQHEKDGSYRLFGGGDEEKTYALSLMTGKKGLVEIRSISDWELTDKMWDETLIGHLLPFKKQPNKTYLFEPKIDPRFELVYTSPSIKSDTKDHAMIGVLIYKIH